MRFKGNESQQRRYRAKFEREAHRLTLGSYAWALAAEIEARMEKDLVSLDRVADDAFRTVKHDGLWFVDILWAVRFLRRHHWLYGDALRDWVAGEMN